MSIPNREDGSTGICGPTGKKMFPTKEAAQLFLTRYARTRDSKKVQRRCAFCDGYHLTKGERGRPGRAR